jgi:glycosyltransferase involved in cell wall biosynthesis
LNPAISIIIPTLQEEKLIQRTLSQFSPALKQKFGIEIIVSDGGSTDRTVEIARRFADTVVEGGGPQNISKGRNIGAHAAQGDVLVFINADTSIEQVEHFFDEMIRIMRQPNVVAATCRVGVYSGEERLSDKIFHTACNWLFYLENVLGLGMGRGECHVLRRDTFLSIGGYNEKIAAGEDFELFVRLKRKGKIVFANRLRVNESPRRYRKYGYLKIGLLWFLNSISVLLFRRSLNKDWKAVR